MRRLVASLDPVVMLEAALQEGARARGVGSTSKAEPYLSPFDLLPEPLTIPPGLSVIRLHARGTKAIDKLENLHHASDSGTGADKN